MKMVRDRTKLNYLPGRFNSKKALHLNLLIELHIIMVFLFRMVNILDLIFDKI